MRQPVLFHPHATRSTHPPYGLFLDPHGGRHHWSAISLRVLLGLTAALGGVAAALAIVAQ